MLVVERVREAETDPASHALSRVRAERVRRGPNLQVPHRRHDERGVVRLFGRQRVALHELSLGVNPRQFGRRSAERLDDLPRPLRDGPVLFDELLLGLQQADRHEGDAQLFVVIESVGEGDAAQLLQRAAHVLKVEVGRLLRRESLRRATLHEVLELKHGVLRAHRFGQTLALALHTEQPRDEARKVRRSLYQQLRLGARALQILAARADVLHQRSVQGRVLAPDPRVERLRERAQPRGPVQIAVREALNP